MNVDSGPMSSPRAKALRSMPEQKPTGARDAPAVDPITVEFAHGGQQAVRQPLAAFMASGD